MNRRYTSVASALSIRQDVVSFLTADSCRAAGRIHDSANRLLGLLNDLLDLERLDSGRMRYEFSEQDLPALVRSVIAELSVLAQQRVLRLIFVGPGESADLECDPVRLSQVVRNLLSNAVKFSPEGGTITVRLDVRPDADRQLELRIRDEGPGIPQAELESIFDKFIQSSITKSGAGGTGLGLAISRQIVHAHGGTLVASNHPDGGAEFICVLPCRQGVTAEPAPIP